MQHCSLKKTSQSLEHHLQIQNVYRKYTFRPEYIRIKANTHHSMTTPAQKNDLQKESGTGSMPPHYHPNIIINKTAAAITSVYK